MRRLSFFLIVAALIPFFLCGCYDSKEIDQTAYMIALGIDKNTENGYTYTLQFAAPKGESTEQEGENSTAYNIVIDAPDFYTAKNMANNYLSKTVDMSHLKMLVFSAKVDSAGFLRHSQFLLREREVRPHISVAVSDNSAEEYIKNVKPHLEASTAKYYELMALRSNNIYAPSKRLSEFVDEINSSGGVSVLPIACTNPDDFSSISNQESGLLADTTHSKIKENTSELSCMAIFKNGKITGLMDKDDTMIFNILKRKIRTTSITFKNPFYNSELMTFRITVPHAAEYTIDNKKKPCHITVSQGFDVEFLGNTLPKGFSSYDEIYSYLDRALTQKIKDYFYDLSRHKNADIMKIEKRYKEKFLTEANPEAKKWQDLFNSATFDINIYFV